MSDTPDETADINSANSDESSLLMEGIAPALEVAASPSQSALPEEMVIGSPEAVAIQGSGYSLQTHLHHASLLLDLSRDPSLSRLLKAKYRK